MLERYNLKCIVCVSIIIADGINMKIRHCRLVQQTLCEEISLSSSGKTVYEKEIIQRLYCLKEIVLIGRTTFHKVTF